MPRAPVAGPSPACLGADTGPGFGWQDVEVFKLGYQITAGSFVLRAGYSRGENPIPSSEVLFNILAPGVPEEHYTAGLSFRVTPAVSLDLALMHARHNPVRGKNPLSNVEAGALELLGGGEGLKATDEEEAVDVEALELEGNKSIVFGGLCAICANVGATLA